MRILAWVASVAIVFTLLALTEWTRLDFGNVALNMCLDVVFIASGYVLFACLLRAIYDRWPRWR